MKKFRRKAVGALKKVGSSSRSRERPNIYDFPAPPSSMDNTPTETHGEEVESEAPEEQAPPAPQGEAPDDSHLVIQGNHENQAYNMLKK